jgi:predicted nucleic acid-binding protein
VILVDSSIWIVHLVARDDMDAYLLISGRLLAHPFVTAELAPGNRRRRDVVPSDLQDLPQSRGLTDHEILQFIDRRQLFGLGIDKFDVHLLAAVRLTFGALLWTRDKRLQTVAEQLGLAAAFSG